MCDLLLYWWGVHEFEVENYCPKKKIMRQVENWDYLILSIAYEFN